MGYRPIKMRLVAWPFLSGAGMVGYQLSGKTFGIVGTGNIGVELIKLLKVGKLGPYMGGLPN